MRAPLSAATTKRWYWCGKSPNPPREEGQGDPLGWPCRHLRPLAAPSRDRRTVVRADNHFHPPIQLPTARLGVAGNRIRLAVALGRYTRRTDAARYQLISHRIGAVLGKVLIE